jgi:hypothetical protein
VRRPHALTKQRAGEGLDVLEKHLRITSFACNL